MNKELTKKIIKLLCKYLTSGSNAPYVLGYLVGVREYV